MLIKDIMTTDLITVDEGTTLRAAVKRMLAAEVPYGIVTNDDVPCGLITDRKVIETCYETGKPMSEIPVRYLANGFEVTLASDTTALFAIATMVKNGRNVLPVMDGVELEGVLTREDVIANVQQFRREAIDLEGRKDRWESPGGEQW